MAWRSEDMRLVGWFARRPCWPTDWPRAAGVEFVCTASACGDVWPEWCVDPWLHNELGLFDSPAAIDRLIPADRTHEFVRLAVRMLPVQFEEWGEVPFAIEPVRPDPIPPHFERLGYDLSTVSQGLECSPTSCNGKATECGANRYCLFDSFDHAITTAHRFARSRGVGVEPGPYVLIEVWADRSTTLH